MRRIFATFAILFLAACQQLEQAVEGSGGSSSSAAGSGGAAGAAAAGPCSGFRDVTNTCLDASCLETIECTAENAEVSCGLGDQFPGTCFGGLCMYESQAGCSAPTDCPCGLCGVDGHCYTDRAGSCGTCLSSGSGGGSAQSTGCMNCLTACSGTGPNCCAGCGCACAAACTSGC